MMRVQPAWSVDYCHACELVDGWMMPKADVRVVVGPENGSGGLLFALCRKHVAQLYREAGRPA